MTNTPHELHDEFPEAAEKIHALKVSNAHFARLAEQYHDLNRRVHRAETGIEPVDQFAEVELRKRRAQIKDEIYRMIRAA